MEEKTFIQQDFFGDDKIRVKELKKSKKNATNSNI
ncbi:MAG: hypothetical protein Ta2D_12530 [Rickettsiales bacterium]|nr:MAG: hypothetical protein Ta2D_12530 [Rickettsiales bacterium]